MNNLPIIWGRELRACFLSPVAYVTTVFVMIAAGGTFLIAVLKNVGSDEPLTTLLFASVMLWLTVLMMVVSMRLFAEEKRSGTIELLMTAPVTEFEVVLGKYAGGLTFVVFVAAASLSSVFVLAGLSPGIEGMDWGALAGGSLILLLVTAFCMAIGTFLSLLTRNQIVAAVGCMVSFWIVLLFGWIISFLPFLPQATADTVSAMAHIDDFTRGVSDTRPIVMYLSGTIFLLFVSVRVFESRRWR
jgi:ABC-2 type transport system permease protein